MPDFWTVTAANILITLLLVPIIVLALFISLRIRDKVAGISWPAMRGKIMGTPTGAALYAGAWVIALGMILSAAIR